MSDFDPSQTADFTQDPLVRRALGLPPLTPPTLTPGREIPMAPPAGGSIAPLPLTAKPGMSLAPAALPAAPPIVSGGAPSLRPATLTPPDPNDPRYKLHGAKRVLTGIAGALEGMGGNLDAARELNPYNRAVAAFNRNMAAQKEQASIDDTRSQTAEREAQGRRADAQANRPDKPATPEEATINDLMTGENGGPRTNPATNKPYTHLEAYKEIKQAAEKPEKTPEADKPLSDGQITQYNSGLADRFKVLNPGKALPPEYTLGKGATSKDFDRVDKLLQATENATGTKTNRDLAESDKKQARDTKALSDRDKFAQPYKQAIDTVNGAEEYVNGGKPTGPGDYALMNQFQETIVAGQKSGIRFTQNEQEMLRNAQSWMNSMRATGRHIVSGTYFSDDQRKQILDVMKGIRERSQKQIDGYDSERSGARSAAPSGNRPPLSSFEH